MADSVLIINAGSSSLKFSLYREDAKQEFVCSTNGLLEGIGTNKPHLIIKDNKKNILYEKNWIDPKLFQSSARGALFDETMEWLFTHLGNDQIIGIGHRFVHGGSKYSAPAIANEKVYEDLKALTPFVPLHQPGSLSPMRVMLDKRPEIVQVACFDTAFHATMPDYAKRFALPRKYYDDGVRRYGFHGLSYQYIVQYLQETNSPLANGKVIVAHLGNGASVTAIHNGKCIDTSMSFTPLDGLVMGTRTGHIDAAIILYMLQEEKLSADEIQDLIWKKSGLLGVSEVSSDMRDIVEEVNTNGTNAVYAKQALDLFTYRLVGEIGRLVTSLQGFDGLIFTAGIGEHSSTLRFEVCKALEWLGVNIDKEANNSGDLIISKPESKILVQTIPTNEELIMLQEVLKFAKN
ncbi:acetate/propionate family kinase [Commensalibacter papalotli (ex Servin-Garciduenas et al. 2014)]|uniref:Acetate kinase n=1 Tax=Commensalibacter papalotli (ex Servin-Garciduenas et al. 2014) TaxID=1208583 RepID=W7DX33_9PROT|nr:acetate/propionate family kinase [Commensalibacter papalotli (ex Servin-Garciduenas et al. 2014)]EUK18753.1 acetate kinase [Commensalibacter papalotli (ex Servin-Garciduenas et al. 2014)]